MDQDDIKSLFGKRLRQARQMAGFSLRELSDKIGGAVSHNALAKYERGEMMPDGSVFKALAKALDQDESFFFRPVTEEIQLVEFRDKSKLGEKQEKLLKHQAQDHFERYLEIEGYLGAREAFKNPLEKEHYATAEDVEKAVEKVRNAWDLGLNPILNIIEALEDNGIKVYEVEAPDEFEGFSGWIDGNPIIVINRTDKNILRLRQTLSHELGHILLKGRLAKNLDEDKAACRFAAAFLMPRDQFREALGGFRHAFTLKELIDIKAAWGISITSLMMRANELNLVSKSLFYRFWREEGKEWREAKAEPGDKAYAGVEKSDRFRRLVYRGVAEGQISQLKGCELLNISLDELRAGGRIIA